MHSWKRAIGAACAGGTTWAWLALAAPSPQPAPEPAPRAHSAAIDAGTAALASEIARLQDRLHPSEAVLAPGRNLFEFDRPAPRAASASAIAPTRRALAADALPPAPSPPPLRLIGVVQDTPGGEKRIAVISAAGGPYFAAKGDTFAVAGSVYAVDEVTDQYADVSIVTGSETTRAARLRLD